MIGWADIVGWLLTHGIRILATLVIGIGLYVATHRVIPPIVRRSVTMSSGESEAGIKKRRDTLNAVFTGGMRGLSYNTNLDHAIEVLNRVGQELAVDEKWKPLIKSVPQVLRVENLGDSGIDIKVWGDVNPGHQWALAGELRKRIKKAFDEEGIEIPWPHTRVYFGNTLSGNG